MKTLNIIATAYRATLEEQDDTILWLTHAMRGAGAELTVLLRGHAVNYAVASQRVEGLRFGAEVQKHPPQLAHDLRTLVDKGVTVFLVEEDAAERGILPSDLLPGPELVRRSDVAKLVATHERIWHW